MIGRVLDTIIGSPLTPLGRLRRALADPAGTQRRLLRSLLARASHTVWGRKYHFDTALCFEDVVSAYQERTPLCGYDDVRGYVQRVHAGEPDVLWPGRTRQFGISGGTVSSGELIPVSRSMLRAMARSSLTPGLQYAALRGPGFLGGKILSIPGGVSPDRARSDVLVGEVSGLMARAAPALLARLFQAVPEDVMLLEDWDDKLQRIVTRTADRDVRAIVMVPSWAPLLFDMVLNHDARRRGTSSPTVRDVWPRLEVFFAGGVALRSYRPILEHYLGPQVALVESYSASEGFFAFQDDLDAPDLLLHVHSGVFYEFVRLEDLDRESPARHTLADVEPEVDYALFVSTCSGLWAYGVGDVVRFTSTSPPRLLVVGRTITILDDYGEALRADEVEQALSVAARLTGAQYVHHHVTYAPTHGPVLQHEWLVEFRVPPRDVGAFAAACDHYLQEHNRHYRIRREPGVLAAPAVTLLPAGTCVTYLRQSRTRLGAQTKLLPMSPQRDIAQSLHDVAALSYASGGAT